MMKSLIHIPSKLKLLLPLAIFGLLLTIGMDVKAYFLNDISAGEPAGGAAISNYRCRRQADAILSNDLSAGELAGGAAISNYRCRKQTDAILY